MIARVHTVVTWLESPPHRRVLPSYDASDVYSPFPMQSTADDLAVGLLRAWKIPSK